MVFSPEQPALYKHDVLFERAGLLPGLQAIGNHIVSSASTPSQSMSFLVSGAYGTGKSSALQYLKGYIRERLEDKVIIAEYIASAFQARPEQARATLIYQLVQALADSAEAKYPIRALVQALKPDQPSTDHLDDSTRRVLDRLLLIRAIEESATAAPILEGWFRQFAYDGESHPSTVVLVDDLDRCTFEFTAAVLQATNHWAFLPNHFFVIACSEQHLERSLAVMYPTMAEQTDSGLRKYVHHTVRLPERILNRAHAAALVAAILEQLQLSDELTTRLVDAIDASANSTVQELGLAAPLVDPRWAPTPRDVKRHVNALLAEVHTWIDEPSLKREIVRAVWPNEWRDFILPALADRRKRSWCSTFVALGNTVRELNLDLDLLDVAIREEAKRTGIDLLTADPLLAVYLACDPPPPRAMFGTADADATPADLADIKPTRQSGRESAEDEEANPRLLTELLRYPVESEPTDGTDAVEDSIDRLLTELEIARARNDIEAMRARANELIERFAAAPELLTGRGLAIRLGNAAIACDISRLTREALQLHGAAIEADQLHANINQNFVSFVLDNHLEQFYGRAAEALDRLETEPTMVTWRTFRTKSLRLKLRSLTGQAVEDLGELLGHVDNEVGADELADVLFVAVGAGQFSLIPRIASMVLAREEENYASQAATAAMLAGAMWASSSRNDEDFSAAIYRALLTTGLLRRLPDPMAAEALMGYARLCVGRELNDRAGYLFYQAFKLHKEAEDIATRFARWLSETGQPDLADRALRKHDIEVPFTLPFTEPLPTSREADAWIAANLQPSYGEPVLPEFFESAEPPLPIGPTS
ncbi:MAG TPA: P-loop NTPase fold protein [Acidimicrobiales bacterium]|nr:P-loop NTPase fold protein [Acidimicrobiales bacterium]